MAGRANVVERHDNVTHIDFLPGPASLAAEPEDDSWWPWAAGAEASGETPTATRTPLPALWCPQPVQVLGRRIARSPFVADLREHGWLVGLVAAAVLCTWLTP